MAEMKLCNNCAMEYDWEGVRVLNYEYCCEACSRGEECTCPQHNHQEVTDEARPAAAAHQGGVATSH